MSESNKEKNMYMLKGKLSKKGYDWWWHSFTGYNRDTNEEKIFFIEYFIMNPKISSDKVVLGQAQESKKNNLKPSYVMIKAGTWGENKKQINNFYPISDLKINEKKLEVEIKNCYLSEEKLIGEVFMDDDNAKTKPEYMSDSGSIKWDLKIDKKITYDVGFGTSKFFRKINAFEMFWHAEGMKTEYSGTVVLDNVIYDIIPEKSYGYADKNWGVDFTSPWIWIASSNMKSIITGKKLYNSAIDIGGGKPKVFGIPINRRILIDFYYEGKEYEFNFSKFWKYSTTNFKCRETEDKIVWEIETKSSKNLLIIKTECLKDDMLKINYESPNGQKRHNKLWNGGNGTGKIELYSIDRKNKILIDEIEMRNIGCEYGVYGK